MIRKIDSFIHVQCMRITLQYKICNILILCIRCNERCGKNCEMVFLNCFHTRKWILNTLHLQPSKYSLQGHNGSTWHIFKFWWYNQSAYINKDLMKSGLKQLIFSAFFTYGKDMLYLSCLFYLNSFISHTLCSTQGHCERFFVKFHTQMHICTCMWDQFNCIIIFWPWPFLFPYFDVIIPYFELKSIS